MIRNFESARIRNKLYEVFAYLVYFIISITNLTRCSLWMDESVEYWFAKKLFGDIPYSEVLAYYPATFIDKIILGGFQPPLYSTISFLWLQIADNEWWFRFLSVLLGFGCMVAIFKTVALLYNRRIAAFAVICASSICRLVYYWQECSEYSLLLCMVGWMLYFAVKYVCNITKEANIVSANHGLNIILFTLFSCLAFCSHYGAVFPIIVIGLSLFWITVRKKSWKNLRTIIISLRIWGVM